MKVIKTGTKKNLEIKNGYLYNYFTLIDTKKITSSDLWIIPSDPEWDALKTYLNNDASQCFTDSTIKNGLNFTYDIVRKPDGTFAVVYKNTTYHRYMAYSPMISNPGRATWIDKLNSIPGGFGAGECYGNAANIRLIKSATNLLNGQSSTYTGNDGKIYKTICVGNQEWLAENLAETKFRDGSIIQNITDPVQWANTFTAMNSAMCAENNDETTAINVKKQTKLIIIP